MKKIPVFTSALLIAGVLATMAFSRPLIVRNGVVRGYSANNSLTIVNHGEELTFTLPQDAQVLPQNSATGLGAGARVTVFAQCFHGGAASATNTVNNGRQANDHVCVALGVLVRAAAPGAVPATGGTGGAAAGTTTPAAGTAGTGGTAAGTSTPAASATTATTTGTETATPMVCPTATVTGTPAAGGGTTLTGTPTAMVPCMTPTATP